MKQTTIMLVGGNGFLGGWVAAALAQRGLRVVIPCRGRPGAKWQKALPSAVFVEADVNKEGVLRSLLPDVDAVINLVGILQDRDEHLPFGAGFSKAHVELPQKIVAAMHASGCRRLVHVSALRAADDAPSAYLRSKAAGEAVLLAAPELDLTVFRPSVIFGANDAFLNLFAQVLRFIPVLPLAGASARFQPVFVGDVAGVLVDALDRPETFGQIYELGGPGVYSLRALVEYVASVQGRRRLILPLPAPLAYLQARLMAFLPNPPMSVDNLRSMQLDNVTTGRHDYPGWNPAALESVAPGYLGNG